MLECSICRRPMFELEGKYYCEIDRHNLMYDYMQTMAVFYHYGENMDLEDAFERAKAEVYAPRWNIYQARVSILIVRILMHDDWHDEIDAAIALWERIPECSPLEAETEIGKLAVWINTRSVPNAN